MLWALFFGLSGNFICAGDSVNLQQSETAESIIEESISRAPGTPTSISGHGRGVRQAWSQQAQPQRPQGCLDRLRSRIKPLHVVLCTVVALVGFAGTTYGIDERCIKAERQLFQGCLAPETNMTGQCYHIAASRCYSYVNGGDYAYQATSPLICATQQQIFARDILQTPAAKNLVTQHPGAALCVLKP